MNCILILIAFVTATKARELNELTPEIMSELARSVKARVIGDSVELPSRATMVSADKIQRSNGDLASEKTSNIQGYMIEKDGSSNIVFVDIAPLGEPRSLSFGDNVLVTPFMSELKLDSLHVEEIERKLNSELIF